VTPAVTAVVLVGGRSTRMGRDKATFVPNPRDGRTLTTMVLDALSPLAHVALLAGREIPGADVPAVPDQYPDAGPLGGIASALAEVRTDLAVVAACDMPSIVPALVERMLQRATQDTTAMCVLCRGDRGLEPLLSVWRAREAAPLLDAALRDGVRAVHEALGRIPHVVIPESEWRALDPEGASFVNWNRPADLP
jgi:molybdopterin-guanine dinucleotide biosynthesis protein A